MVASEDAVMPVLNPLARLDARSITTYVMEPAPHAKSCDRIMKPDRLIWGARSNRWRVADKSQTPSATHLPVRRE